MESTVATATILKVKTLIFISWESELQKLFLALD